MLMVIVLLLVGCSFESGSTSTVNSYLNAIKNGKDTFEYKDFRVGDFINVLDYKFLNVVSTKQVDYVVTVNQESFNSMYKQQHSNLAETIASFKQVYGKDAVVSETFAELKIVVDKLDECILLYDVTHTNALGQKLYGKFYFVVRQKLFEKTFEILDWYK